MKKKEQEIKLYEGLSEDKVELLKNTVCRGANNNEFELFLHVCNKTGLDPFMKQIYAIKRKEAMTIQTSIDGYRLIAERTGKYSPGREPTFAYDQNNKLLSATAYIKKQTQDGSWHEVAATAFYREYVQEFNGKPTKFWEKMGHTMTAKCAEALALRKAFPDFLSGIYTADEMQQANSDLEDMPDNEPMKSIPYHKPTAAQIVSEEEVAVVDDVKPIYITQDQGKELALLIAQCPQGYQDRVWKVLLDNKGITRCEEMTVSLYESTKKKVLAEMKKNADI